MFRWNSRYFRTYRENAQPRCKYLRERRRQCKGKAINHTLYQEANNAHERALVFMHKMPRIWIDYGEFLMRQEFVTRTRRTFDRALR